METISIVLGEIDGDDGRDVAFIAGAIACRETAEAMAAAKNLIASKYHDAYDAWCKLRGPLYWALFNDGKHAGLPSDEQEAEIARQIGPMPRFPGGEIYASRFTVVTIPANCWGQYEVRSE